jgi:hypothetical protein
MQNINWQTAAQVKSYSYTCGYCGSPIASEKGWAAHNNMGIVYLCHQCTRPTFIDFTENEKQSPGVVFGNSVQHIPEHSVSALYDEARACTGAGAYTAAVLACRKLLMHISVSKGAEENKSFAYYVKYLSDNHYVPRDANDWVDHIRNKGNEANHEISIMPKDEAEELLSFCEMLLKVIYEFPTSVKNKYIKTGE